MWYLLWQHPRAQPLPHWVPGTSTEVQPPPAPNNITRSPTSSVGQKYLPSSCCSAPRSVPKPLPRRATGGGDTELVLYLSRACPAAISSPNQVTVPQGRHAETPEPSPPLQDAVLRRGGQRAWGKGKRVWGESRRRGERGGKAGCPKMTAELNEARMEGYMGWTGRKQQWYGDGDKN